MFVDMVGNGSERGGGEVGVAVLPRRRPVVGTPGVYYRPRRDGMIGSPYEFRYLDSVGRRRWRVVWGSLEEVLQERAQVAFASGRRGRGLGGKGPQERFECVSADWLARQTVGPRTIEIYGWALRCHLLPYFGAKRLDEIKVEEIALFIASMRQAGFKGWTILSVLRPLSIILAQACRRGSIAANPMTQLERGERPGHDDERLKRILSLEEMHEVLAETASDRHRLLFELLMTSGLRIGEALGLTVGDLDREHAVISVEYQLGRNGSRSQLKTPSSRRAIDIPEPLAGRLVELIEERGEGGNAGAFVFSTRNATGLARKTCREALKRACVLARLRLPHPTLHDLRHSHASMLIALGCNVSDVQHRLGHRKPDTTLRIYTHQWSYRDVQEGAIAARLAPLF